MVFAPACWVGTIQTEIRNENLDPIVNVYTDRLDLRLAQESPSAAAPVKGVGKMCHQGGENVYHQ